MATGVCKRLLEQSEETPPSDMNVERVDSAICAVLCIVFLLVYVRYVRWAWGARGSRGSALNCVLAAASFYLLLSLPALWVRTTLAWRTHTAVDAASRSCQRSNIAKLCNSECPQVAAAQKRLKADPPPRPIAVQALGASLAGAFVLVTVVFSLLCRFNILSTPQGVNSRRSELSTDSVRPRRKTDKFVLTILDPPSNSNANADANDKDDDDCCIVCLGELWDARVCELACGHRFHVRCISKWLSKSHRPLCPLCQCDVRKEEEDQDVRKEHDVP